MAALVLATTVASTAGQWVLAPPSAFADCNEESGEGCEQPAPVPDPTPEPEPPPARDTTPPDTFITEGPAEGSTITTNAATFSFEGTVGDTARLQCALDSSESFFDCSSPLNFAGLSEGAHTVRFRAVDGADNIDQTPAMRSFTVVSPVPHCNEETGEGCDDPPPQPDPTPDPSPPPARDTTPPDTFITEGPAEGSTITTNAATFRFEGTAGDTAKLQCALDRGEFADCTSPHTFADLSEGPHTVRFRAVDGSDNADATPATRSFGVDTRVGPPSPPSDTTAPETVITAGPQEGATLTTGSATFSFEGTAGDTARLQCSLDGAEFADCTSPRTFVGLSDGAHTVRFRALDTAGNTDATPATRTFTVDTTPVVPPVPENAFRVPERGTANTAKGTRTIEVVVPGPGTVRVSPLGAAPVRTTTETATRGGATAITITPTRAGKRLLVRNLRQARAEGRSSARIRVRVEVVYTPEGGAPKVVERVYTLTLERTP